MKNGKFYYLLKIFFLQLMFLMLSAHAWTQDGVTVTGKITDESTGEPLPGANVQIAGTSQGTVTNLDGEFELEVPDPNVTLKFSYVGYLEENIALEGQTNINVQLVPDLQELDQVVVVGYGTMRKRDLTGAVSSVNQEDIAASKSNNVLEVMQGKVAGLDLSEASGESGSGVDMSLRGTRSLLASNDPLILVNGVEYGSTLDLNPSDIESIEVLKDASSTAIYGTRGANGVILITTKDAEKGELNVTFNSYVSHNSPSFLPDIMGSSDFIDKRIETVIGNRENEMHDDMSGGYSLLTYDVDWDENENPEPWSVYGTVSEQQLIEEEGVDERYELVISDQDMLELLDQGVSLNYMDHLLRNSVSDNYELGVYGGTEKTTASFSLGLMNDRGLLRDDIYKRYNLKLGVTHDVSDNISMGGNIILTHKNHNRRDGGAFNQALKTGPIGRLYDDDGNLTSYPDPVITFAQPNPLLDEAEGQYTNDIVTNRLFGSNFFQWELLSGLTVKSNFGYNITNVKDGLYQGPRSLRGINQAESQSNIRSDHNWSYTWDNTINYNKTFGIHEIQALLGHSMRKEKDEWYGFTQTNQPVDATEYYDWVQVDAAGNSQFRQNQLLSYFGRMVYKYSELLILQGTLRADGSSVLSEGNEWGYFPSVSAGFRLSELNSMKNISGLSNLKLRASWGEAGTAAVRPYGTLTQVSDIPTYYTFDDGSTYSTFIPFQVGNDEVRWETTRTMNFGVDFGLFNNRIYGNVDYYISNTDDLLMQTPLPPSSAYTQVLANVASTKNQGVEVTLNTQNFRGSDFQWSTDWTFSLNRSEITSLNENTEEIIYNDGDYEHDIWRVGEPVNSFIDYEYEGVYQISDLQEEYEYVSQQRASGDSIDVGQIPMLFNGFYPGDSKLKDKNGDGEITAEDRVLYNRDPKFVVGINNNLSYRTDAGEFGLSFFLFTRVGQTIFYDYYDRYKPASQIVENGPDVDAWTPDNTDALFPRYSSDGNANTPTYVRPISYVDGTYVKIKDVTLSYALPPQLIERVNVNKLRIYVTAKNYFTFAKIDNYDPERGGSMDFPLAKQIIAGVNLEF